MALGLENLDPGHVDPLLLLLGEDAADTLHVRLLHGGATLRPRVRVRRVHLLDVLAAPVEDAILLFITVVLTGH